MSSRSRSGCRIFIQHTILFPVVKTKSQLNHKPDQQILFLRFKISYLSSLFVYSRIIITYNFFNPKYYFIFKS